MHGTEPTAVEVLLLGPWELRVQEAPQAVGRQQVRLLIAALSLGSEPVGADELIDFIWPDRLPQNPRGSLQVIVTRARQALAACGDSIGTSGDRYSLEAASDVQQFLSVAHGNTAETTTCRLDELRGALNQWRGRPFEGVPSRALFEAHGHQLGAARDAIRRELLGILSRAQLHDEVIALAGPIVDDEPASELEASLLAQSLAATGQRRRALTMLAATRRELVLAGLTPSSTLTDAEADVLNHSVDLPHGPPAETANVLLLGRSEEIALMTNPAIDRLVITGEAGMGKTQLLDAARERWCTVGRQVAMVNVSERPPRLLDPIAQLLEALIDDNVTLADPLGAVGLLLPDGSQPPAHVTSSRDELMDALVAAVSLRLDESYTVVVDDAHWLDGLSREVLMRLAAESPAQMVFAARNDRHNIELPGATTLALQPLQLDTIEEWMSKELGETSAVTGADLLRRTGGNPLFLRLLMDLLIDEVSEPDLPATILALVKERIDELSPPARDLVRVAAVLGSATSLSTLAAFDLDVSNGLDEAISAGLLRKPADQVEFVHGLVCDAAAQLQGAGRNIAIHDQAARICEEQGAQPVQYWRHCLETVTLDPHRARRVLIDAAEQYAEAYFWHEAITCLEAARVINTDAEQRPKPYEIDTQLARAYFMAARGGDRELLDSAISDARAAGDAAGEARAIAELAQRGCYALLGTDPDPVAEHLERGLSLTLGADDRARLLAPAARALGYSRHHRVGHAHYRTAYELLDSITDRRTRWTILRNAEYGLSDPASLDLAERACSEMELEMGHNDEIQFLVGWTRYRHAIMRGDPDLISRYRQATRQAVEIIDGQRQRLAYGHAYAVRFQFEQLESSYALLAGNPEQAEQHAENALQMIGEYFADRSGDQGKAWAIIGYAALMVGIRQFQGRLAELAPMAAGQQSPVPAWRTAVAAAQFAANDLEAATATLRELAANNFEQLVPDQSYTGALAILAEPAAALLDQSSIEQLYQLIEPLTDRWSLGGVVSFGPMAAAGATLAHALGRSDEAERLTQRAADATVAMRSALS